MPRPAALLRDTPTCPSEDIDGFLRALRTSPSASRGRGEITRDDGVNAHQLERRISCQASRSRPLPQSSTDFRLLGVIKQELVNVACGGCRLLRYPRTPLGSTLPRVADCRSTLRGLDNRHFDHNPRPTFHGPGISLANRCSVTASVSQTKRTV